MSMRISEETILVLKIYIFMDDAKQLADELKNVNFTDRPMFREFYKLLPDYSKE